MDIKLTDLCKRASCDRKKLDDLIDKLGISRHKVPLNSWAVKDKDAQILLRELGLPAELQGETFWAKHLHDGRNKRWVFAKIQGVPNKHPVLVPPRFAGKLTGKRFKVERIEDKDGVTWRHEWFRKIKTYDR